MDSYPVYIPDPAAPDRIRLSVKHIDARSAIVSNPDPAGDLILIYYEGGRYRAANTVTFADRARRAAERLAANAPTVAMCAAPRAALLQVGVLQSMRGIDLVEEPATVAALARWLELFDGERVDSSALYTQLRPSH
jgi:hypothetical protein